MIAAHKYFAWIVVASNIVAGIWGLYLWRKKKTAPKQYWYTLGAAWVTVYIQGLLGLVVYEKVEPLKHTFYGFLLTVVTLLILPLRGERADRRLAIFAGATLFIGIVAVRAIISAVPL